ncbi:MAG: hypothetical protein HXY36_06090 [Chloroflexi bacterium]|nr:hypothetical protein [Chloroflexota bacterium]
MIETEKLPEGIRLLREFQSNNGRMSSKRFERLVLKLEKCAGNGRRVRCCFCSYLKECRERFDTLCG